MATYLLTWNPKTWQWDTLSQEIEAVNERGSYERRWSCGTSRRLKTGDRAFLLRQGKEPRGIMGSGTIVKGSFEGPHWDPERREHGETCFHVMVSLDTLYPKPVIPRRRLDAPPFKDMYWNAQSSGTTIPEHVAQALEEEWARLTSPAIQMIPEEVLEGDRYIEGATRQILINSFERDRRARQACIDHYGLSCTVCGFNFEERYGDAGAGLIHVHHLKPLSEIEGAYVVDPVTDLRPVCPNCHAVIHRRNPPYSIGEVQAMLTHAQAS